MKPIYAWLFLFVGSVTMAQTPVMTWDFETIKDGKSIEPATQIADTIEGNFEQAAGIRGKGLRLDGFTTRVIRTGRETVKPGDELTVEAWVSLSQYPENWCPVITTESDEVKGYRLQIGPYGQVSFETAISEQWVVCSSANETMPLRKWMHLVGVYTAGKAMTLYVNGKAVRTLPIDGALTYPKKNNAILGMVAAPKRPSDTIRTWGTMPTYYGLSGIMDEIMVFDQALTARQVKSRFSKVAADTPDIQAHRLPTIKKNPGRFGAFYTKLKYHDAWDNLWRVDQDPDIVVCFDNSPVKFIFWRGIRYGPAWVSENDNWMTDQSLETWGNGANDIEGCFEHMQDRHCRFSHVRIIESSDARAVIHWRYALVSAHDHIWMTDPKTDWGCWADEYYYIYPDGSAIRKVSWQKGSTGRAVQYQESLPVTQPGQRSKDLLEDDYVRVADYEYNSRTVSVDPSTKSSDWKRDYTIQQFQFKSKNKPYICFEPGNRMWVRWINGGYNHFPVNQARSDGRWARTTDRPTHIMSSPCSDPIIHEQGNRLSWYALYGMNTMATNELVTFGRSWAYAPALSTGRGFASRGYDRSQRCYQIENTSGKSSPCKLTLKGSKDSPLLNPAFCIKNWDADDAKILINGKAHANYKTGINRTLEGTDLVVFVTINKTEPVTITVLPAD
ncbi:MAG: LamG domain-containing protein [Planctomycetes bacterium]|nr:LamG domain-containing protein [Planctomycetota bacterium]